MTVIIGHRGSHVPGEGPEENTLPAIEAALTEEAEIIEFDVQASRSGTPWVFHDDTLDRMTGGQHTGALADLDDEALAEVRLARGGRLPRFDEVMALLQGKVGIVLDFKDLRSLQPALEVVRARRMFDQCIISSAVDEVVARARDEAPGVARALVMGGEPEASVKEKLSWSYPFWRLKAVDAQFWHPHWQCVHPNLVSTLRSKGLRTNVWTVNDTALLDTLSQVPVDGIFTDRPGVMQRWLGLQD